MRALVVAPQPFYSPRGTPFSVYYRTLLTARQKVEIDFVTYGQGEDVDIPGVRFFRIPAFKAFGPVKIGPSKLKLFLDLFIFFQMVRLLLTRRYDFVHLHEEAVFMALVLKPIFRFKMVYDMHSSLSQQMTNFSFTQSKVIIGIFRLLEELSLRYSEAIITICPDLRDYVNGIIHNRKKHFLIENSIFDPVQLKNSMSGKAASDKPHEAVQIATQLKRQHNRLVVYAGTLEPYQGIDILVDAMAAVVKDHPDVHCLVMGGAPLQVEKFKEHARARGALACMSFTGQVPQAVAKQGTALADVLVSPRSEGTNTPLKVYEQLASGIPLVATRIYSHTQVLNDAVAFLAEPNGENFALSLGCALSDPDQSADKVVAAKRLYDREYAPHIYEQKIQTLLKWLR